MPRATFGLLIQVPHLGLQRAPQNGTTRDPGRLLHWARRAAAGLGGLALLATAAGALCQLVATQLDRHSFPPAGQLVNVDGYTMHLSCFGQGQPTVMLESGLAAPVAVWAWVQPAVATSTRVCAYDRAGVGWSDMRPEARDARQIARELHALLGVAGVAPPYVLVGHSYGGNSVRVYAADYPDEVAGVVLVDASHPSQWTSGADARAAYRDIERLNGAFRFLAPTGVLRLFGYFPAPPDLPARQAAEVKAFLDSTQVAEINAAEFAATPATDDQVRAGSSLGKRPLFVLTATDHGESQQQERQWQIWQRDLTSLSTDGVQEVVDGASHVSLLFNETHARTTSTAILRLVDAVRGRTPLTWTP